jgi:hypothetical protein
MGGLVGAFGKWTYFNKRWGKMLRRSNIRYYHTKRIRDSDGEFRGWSTKRKAALVVEAGESIQVGTFFGFSMILQKDGYLENYKNEERPRKIQLDSMYGLCFRYCAILAADLVQRTLKRDDIVMNFILESGAKNAGDAQRIFGELKRDDVYKNLFCSIVFGGKEAFFGLQGADYVSHTTFVAEQDKPALTEFPEQANVRDAQKIVGHKSPTFRWHLHVDWLKDIKRKTMELDAKRIEFGQRKPKVRAAAAE